MFNERFIFEQNNLKICLFVSEEQLNELGVWGHGKNTVLHVVFVRYPQIDSFNTLAFYQDVRGQTFAYFNHDEPTPITFSGMSHVLGLDDFWIEAREMCAHAKAQADFDDFFNIYSLAQKLDKQLEKKADIMRQKI